MIDEMIETAWFEVGASPLLDLPRPLQQVQQQMQLQVLLSQQLLAASQLCQAGQPVRVAEMHVVLQCRSVAVHVIAVSRGTLQLSKHCSI
jgi:hypothetical protein